MIDHTYCWPTHETVLAFLSQSSRDNNATTHSEFIMILMGHPVERQNRLLSAFFLIINTIARSEIIITNWYSRVVLKRLISLGEDLSPERTVTR